MTVFVQYPLPGVIEIVAEPTQTALSAPAWVLALLREAVIERLPADAPPAIAAWIDDARAGRFDDGPLMQAAIAGWNAARGRA